MEGGAVTLPRIGRVRLRESLRFSGKIMGAVVSRIADRWFISVQVEVGGIARKLSGNAVVGIDLGLTTFVTLSSGEKIEAPKPLATLLRRLAQAQRVLSRRRKGSNRRERSKTKVARLHARVVNIRSDFLHKLTTRLCRENQAIAIEDLCVQGMV